MIALYLALRTLQRDKKRYLLLVGAIAILLAATIAVSVVTTNALGLSIVNEEISHGRWHMAYVAESDIPVQRVRRESVVESASLGYRLDIPMSEDDFKLDLTLFQGEWFADFTRPIIAGSAPAGKDEILVPDWVLRRYNLDSLPAIIKLEGFEFTVTGIYKGRVREQGQKVVPAYGVIEGNGHLLNPALLAGVPGRVYALGTEYFDGLPMFVYIRLAPGIKVEHADRNLGSLAGIIKFQTSDMFSRNYTTESPHYNGGLIQAEGRHTLSLRGISSAALAMIIGLILMGALFVMVFIAMSVVVSNSTSTLGLYSALGLKPLHGANLVVLQALICGILAIPLGGVLGLGGSYLVMGSSVKAYLGGFTIPWPGVGLSILVCFVAIIFGAALPALKVRVLSPMAALKAQTGVSLARNDIPPWLKLNLVRGKDFFSAIYGLKQVAKDTTKLVGLTLVITALLTLFILISADIEREWKVGDRRQSYQPDHVISVPFLQFNSSAHNSYPYTFNRNVRYVDDEFRAKLNSLPATRRAIYQYGVLGASEAREEDVLYYQWQVPISLISQQGKQHLRNYSNFTNSGKALIPNGVIGYNDEGLEFAKGYLVEGAIDITRMASEPVILLPKYVPGVEKLDIPLLHLKVGDKITLVESVWHDFHNSTVINEISFTIGGFVDRPPLLHDGTWFTAIMHAEQLMKLQTAAKGVMNIYVDDRPGLNSYSQLKELSGSYGYSIWSPQTHFDRTERMNEYAQMQRVAYILFSVLVVVMFLVIFSLLSSEILVRKQEFAMLHSIGMTKDQILLSVLLQGVIPGLLGSFLGCNWGIFMIGQIDWGEILTTSQLVPVGHLVVGVLVVLSSCLAATFFSVRDTVKNLNVQDVKSL